jgi:nitroreductase
LPPIAKPAETSRPVHDLIRTRWSPRAFGPTPVPADALVAIMEAGRWAASSNNVQPWRYLVATAADSEGHAALVKAFNARNQRWTASAPVLMVVLAHRTVQPDDKPNAHAWYDAGAATAQMAMQATALGLHMHQAAGIDRDYVRASLGVPEDVDIIAGLALGYQGDAANLPEDLAAREVEPRKRRPLDETFYGARFNTPLKVG